LLPPKATICTNCGASLRPDTRFCAQCGHPVFAVSAIESAPSSQPARAPEGYAAPLPGGSAWTAVSPPPARHAEADFSPFSYPETPSSAEGETQEVGYAVPAYPTIPAPPSLPARRAAAPRWVWLVGGLVLGVIVIVLVVAAFLLLNAFVLHLF